jgi:hypothetical protein
VFSNKLTTELGHQQPHTRTLERNNLGQDSPLETIINEAMFDSSIHTVVLQIPETAFTTGDGYKLSRNR